MRDVVRVLGAIVISAALAAPAAAVTNGVPDGTRHTYVGIVAFADGSGTVLHTCDGSLLNPTVILTAAHCAAGSSVAHAWFDPSIVGNADFPNGGPSAFDGTPAIYPAFDGFAGDIAVVVLDQAVPTSRVSHYASLPTAGAVDRLANKTPLDYVGFGVQFQVHSPGSHPIDRWQGDGTRTVATGALVSGNFSGSGELMKVSMTSGGTTGGYCFHDSGSPQLLGGTDVVLALQAFVNNANCSGVGYGTRVDIGARLAWVSSFTQ